MKRYTRINWQDAPSTNTPRNALFFNKMDKGIDDLDNAIEEHQAQINQIVKTGDSSVEAAQARVAASGTTYATLKARLDSGDSQLAAKANKEQAENIQSQVNALVVGAGTSSAEVVQNRVAKNGVTFPTVKAKSDNIENTIKNGISVIPVTDWEIGGISESTGVNQTLTTRIRTTTAKYLTFPNETITIHVTSGYLIGVFYYSYANSVYTFTGFSGWKSADFLLDLTKGYYKFVILQNPEASATLDYANYITFDYPFTVYMQQKSVKNSHLDSKCVTTDKTDFINSYYQYLLVANKTLSALYNLSGTTVQTLTGESYSTYFIYAPVTLEAGTYYISQCFASQSVVYDLVTGTKQTLKAYLGITPTGYKGLITLTNKSTLYLSFYTPEAGTPMLVNNTALPSSYKEGLYELRISKLVADADDAIYQKKYDFSNIHFPYIKDNRLKANPNAGTTVATYAGVDIGAGNVPNKMFFKCYYSVSEANEHAVLITNPLGINRIGQITTKSLHCVFMSQKVHVELYDNSVTTPLYTESYGYNLAIDTEYTFGIEISGNTLKITTATGEHSVDVSAYNLSAYIGRYCIIEHYGDTVGLPQFTEFKVFSGGICLAYDNFKRPDGAAGNMVSGQPYVLMSGEAAYNWGYFI